MLRLFAIIIFLTLSFSVSIIAQDNKTTDKESALATALKYSGFDDLGNVVYKTDIDKIIKIKLKDENIPFWSEEEDSHDIWVVPFFDVSFLRFGQKIDSSTELAKRDIKFYIDAETSQLVKVTSLLDSTDSFFMNNITKESLEKRIHSVNYGKWLGFAESSPDVTFNNALRKSIPIRSSTALQIYAVCVYKSMFSREPQLVWEVLAIIPEGSFFGNSAWCTMYANHGDTGTGTGCGSF